MKPSLQLTISQQLTLTPQLQQAIRLLQLSTVDLQKEIQEVLESNPMLDAESTTAPFEETNDFHVQQLYQNPIRNNNFTSDDFNYENFYAATTNLQDNLRWQLELTPLSQIDKVIATAIIDAIDDDGFLTATLEELQETLNNEGYVVSIEQIKTVQHRLQHFDPAGCAATSLAETLLVQLDQFEQSEAVELAQKIIAHDIALLGQRNYQQLMKNHKVNEETLHQALQLIQRLNPKPGSIINQAATEYIIPDITVKKIADHWQVFLNQNTLPRLKINQDYSALIRRADNSTDNQFLKNNLQEARWFLKSIQSRQETLLKVARCIVEYQKDFFEYGEEAMKPLILQDIARAVDLHESTISRVTTQKYMHTPRGVLELKYFFSSHVNTATGQECSSTAIRAIIKKLIAAENCKKPLSDSKLAKLIASQGKQVARRTIAKYREAMHIAPSGKRKKICS